GFTHLGQPEKVIGMLPSRRLPRATLDQACLGVLTHRLEKSVAHGAGLWLDRHQRPVDQRGQHVPCISARVVVTRPEGLRRLQIESSREYRQRLEPTLCDPVK